MTTKQQFQPFKVAAIAGFFSWIGDVILFPIDTVSTRLKGDKTKSHNSLKFLWKEVKSEGTKLSRGISLTLPHSFLPTVVYLYTYENLMKYISEFVERHTERKQLKLIFPFFVSGFTEMLCLFVELPFDTLRTRIQVCDLLRKMDPNYKYTSLKEGLVDIVKKQGFFRFYKSTRIFFVSKTVYTAIQFQCFELMRYFGGPSVVWLLLNTVVSSAIATSIVNPLEVLITRYALVDTTKKKLFFKEIVTNMIKKEGFQGFYKGYVTEVLLHSVYALFWLPIFQLLRENYGVNLSE